VIQEDTPPPPDTTGPPASEPPDTFDAAISAAATLVMALSSAIAEVAFADAARLRTELEQALSRASTSAARLSDCAARDTALRQLGEMRGAAIRMFQIAPAPSAAAIAAAESGNRAAWIREEQAWITGRLASGTNPRIPRLRRERRDTRPDSPKALRLTSGEEHDASDEPAQAALAAPPSADDEDPR
jgi:hypothetical protein